MRTVSDVLQNKGGHVEFTSKDGKTYKIQYLTLRIMSQYENKMQNKAIRKLCEQKDVIPADLFQQLFSKIMDDIASGHYAFGGDIVSKSLQTIGGIADLISLMVGITEDEAMDLLTREQDVFRPLFDEVIRKSIGSRDDEKPRDSEGNG